RGDKRDWELVVARVAAVPDYFEKARVNLDAGKRDGILPDRRMVKRDGIGSITASVDYFRVDLPAKAKTLLGNQPFAAPIMGKLGDFGEKAALACASFVKFLAEAYDSEENVDRFAIGEEEYAWRLKLLRIESSPGELFAYGARRVAEYR